MTRLDLSMSRWATGYALKGSLKHNYHQYATITIKTVRTSCFSHQESKNHKRHASRFHLQKKTTNNNILTALINNFATTPKNKNTTA